MGLGMFLFSALRTGDGYADLMPGVLLIGVGAAMGMPLVMYVLKAVPEQRAGVASGVINVIREASGAFGIAIVGLLVHAVPDEGASAADLEAFRHGTASGLILGAAVVLIGGLISGVTLPSRRGWLGPKHGKTAPSSPPRPLARRPIRPRRPATPSRSSPRPSLCPTRCQPPARAPARARARPCARPGRPDRVRPSCRARPLALTWENEPMPDDPAPAPTPGPHWWTDAEPKPADDTFTWTDDSPAAPWPPPPPSPPSPGAAKGTVEPDVPDAGRVAEEEPGERVWRVVARPGAAEAETGGGEVRLDADGRPTPPAGWYEPYVPDDEPVEEPQNAPRDDAW